MESWGGHNIHQNSPVSCDWDKKMLLIPPTITSTSVCASTRSKLAIDSLAVGNLMIGNSAIDRSGELALQSNFDCPMTTRFARPESLGRIQ